MNQLAMHGVAVSGFEMASAYGGTFLGPFFSFMCLFFFFSHGLQYFFFFFVDLMILLNGHAHRHRSFARSVII